MGKFKKLLDELRAMSHEERMERVKLLIEAWREHEKRRQIGSV